MASSTLESAMNDRAIRPARSYWQDIWRRLRRNRRAMLGLGIVVIIILSALFAPWLAPHEAFDPNPRERLHTPDSEYWMGTDDLGRDILSRLLYGARVSLQVGLIAVGIAAVIGVLVGAVAGYYGRWIDNLLMRFADMFLAIPSLVLALALISVLKPSLGNVMIAIGITGWVSYARIVRGQFLSLRQQDFVTAAQMVGAGTGRIIFRHILPNAIGPVIVVATFGMASAILSEAGLSFLGLGVQPPNPSWGSMLTVGKRFLQVAPHIATFPGLAILITVLGFNLLGDGLRDALDPRMDRNQ